jgi:hypothetical protein
MQPKWTRVADAVYVTCTSVLVFPRALATLVAAFGSFLPPFEGVIGEAWQPKVPDGSRLCAIGRDCTYVISSPMLSPRVLHLHDRQGALLASIPTAMRAPCPVVLFEQRRLIFWSQFAEVYHGYDIQSAVQSHWTRQAPPSGAVFALDPESGRLFVANAGDSAFVIESIAPEPASHSEYFVPRPNNGCVEGDIRALAVLNGVVYALFVRVGVCQIWALRRRYLLEWTHVCELALDLRYNNAYFTSSGCDIDSLLLWTHFDFNTWRVVHIPSGKQSVIPSPAHGCVIVPCNGMSNAYAYLVTQTFGKCFPVY